MEIFDRSEFKMKHVTQEMLFLLFKLKHKGMNVVQGVVQGVPKVGLVFQAQSERFNGGV